MKKILTDDSLLWLFSKGRLVMVDWILANVKNDDEWTSRMTAKMFLHDGINVYSELKIENWHMMHNDMLNNTVH